jgi:hypothetical protein
MSRITTHKKLWGRAAGRCSICGTSVTDREDLGEPSTVGEEAHIIAQSTSGPRGDNSIDPKLRDEYENLILLCPNHHAEIDQVPRGTEQYSVATLHQIKEDHEKRMATTGVVRSPEQLLQEQWAEIVDQLGELMPWDRWADHFHFLLSPAPSIYTSTQLKLQIASSWIQSRIWPTGNEELREAIEGMDRVMGDFLNVFESRASWAGNPPLLLQTDRFYRISHWDEKLYSTLLAEFNHHVGLVKDLGLELTRYGNLVATITREKIDSSYRVREGALTIRSNNWRDYRPEFRAEDLESGNPYRGLPEFMIDRKSRDVHFA